MKFKTRRYIIYYLGRVAIFFVGLLPLKLSVSLGAKLGEGIYRCLPKQRKLALDHLKIAFPDKEKTVLESIAKESFANLGRNLMELINFRQIKKDITSYIEIVGYENLLKALKDEKGVLAYTGHIGNWELLPMMLSQRGFEGGVIARKVYFERFNEYYNRLRAVGGVEYIDRDKASRRVLKLLKDNKIIGVLIDQDVKHIDGVFVRFFGKLAFTPSAPVNLALRTGARLLPCFMVREGIFKHKLVFHKPIDLIVTGDKEKDCEINTQMITDIIEDHIRDFPTQWVWMHRRWKTRPE